MSIRVMHRNICLFDILSIYMKLPKVKFFKSDSIVRFLEKRFPEILLILILLLVCVLSIRLDKYVLSNDNYSVELNPTLSVSRYLQSPAWRGYRVLGFASESEQADIFRSFLYSIFDSIIPSWLISQLFYFVSLTVGSICIASLIRRLIRNSKLKRYSNWAFLLGGITYFTTLWSMWLFYQNMAPYIVNFGFLPLLLLCIYLYSKENSEKYLLFIFLSSLLLTSTFIIATLFIIDFVFIFSFTIFVNLSSKYGRKREIKNILLTIGIFLLTQLFWILPFINYTVNTSSDIIDSYTNRTITSNTIDLETDSQTLANSARFYNRNFFEKDGDKFLFPMSELFITYDFYKVLGLFPAIFSIIALTYAVFKKNYKLFFWGVVGLISLFLIKVVNPPFGEVFKWFQENIPLFKQVLRWPFSKLGQIYLICITVLSTFGVIYLIKFFASFIQKRFLKRIFILTIFVSICILQLVYSEYLFRGDFFSDRAILNVPNRYFELEKYLSENDSTGRIYYAPPSNNNYFREYDWGFWGSQYISYILPNPVMDISSAIGSKVGEDALLRIANVVRSEKKDEFNSLMHKYDVRYVLFDGSVDMKGYAFELDEEKVKGLFSEYELIWSEDDLLLFKVPVKMGTTYSESLSEVKSKEIYIKDRPKFPSLSPLDIQLKDLRIENGDIVGDFEYKGYSTYLSSNLSKESINMLPSKFEYSNGSLFLYPSYPYVGGDSSEKPFKQYDANSQFFSFGQTVLSKEDIKRGVTVQEIFNSERPIYEYSNSDFITVDMIPLLFKTKGSDCSGGEVVESTFVTPQEVSSGFSLKGSSDSPCVYTGIPLDTSSGGIMKININWEVDKGNYPGFCIYSNTKEKCLNKEKFLSSQDPFGNIEILLESVIDENERISLILYATNKSKENNSEVLYRSVKIKYAPKHTPSSIVSSSEIWEPSDLFLDDGNIYSVHIPVVIGEKGYLYNGIKAENIMWQSNRSDSQSEIFEVSSKNGLYQKVQDDYINQTANLFEPNFNSKYLVYWKGENISNIPSSLCLIYDKEEKCWFSDMLLGDTSSSYLNTINVGNTNKLLNVIYSSSSYKLVTENILKEFSLMELPTSWDNLMYTQNSNKEYLQIEMQNIFNSPNSTYYKLKREDIVASENILISIPQAHSSGWVAVAREGIWLKVLGKDTRVSIEGWKQGWDVSNIDYDSVSVIYWPNLLSYFGYILILGLGTYLVVNLIKNNKSGKY